MTCHHIALLDNVALSPRHQEQIRLLSDSPVRFPETDPVDERDLVNRSGDADTILVSWRSRITAGYLDSSIR